MNQKLLRAIFWPLWFVVIPLCLAALTVSLLGSGDAAIPEGWVGRIRFFVQDQKVPSVIVFFTLYEMLFYQIRYSLPLSERLGVAGRAGLPKDLRRDFEHAGQMMEEVKAILRKNHKEVEDKLPPANRAELDQAMERLSRAMSQEAFDREEFKSAYHEAMDLAAKNLAPWQRGEVREYTESILIAFAVALLLRAFLVEAFKIPSGSMLPTLQLEDHIFVNKFTYGPTLPFTRSRLLSDLPPERGDIVVFEYPDPNPNSPRPDYIKRAIALPGDTLETIDGHPVINGWTVPNCYVGKYEFLSEGDYPDKGELFLEFLGDESYLTFYRGADQRETGVQGVRQGPFHVKEGEFWVMGDNRNNSNDSRLWQNADGRTGAGVPFENVKGRAMFVWLAFNKTGRDAFGVTWDRLFTDVMGRPRLPKEAPEALKARIDSCLSQRPEHTTPPGPAERELEARTSAH